MFVWSKSKHSDPLLRPLASLPPCLRPLACDPLLVVNRLTYLQQASCLLYFKLYDLQTTEQIWGSDVKQHLLLAALLLIPTAPAIAEESRWYVGGALHRFDLDAAKSTFQQPASGLPVVGTPAQGFEFDADIDGDTDIALLGGWDAPNYDIRLEFEYRKYASDISNFGGSGSGQVVSGEADAQQLVVMAYYDIREVAFIPATIKPYLGLGVGGVDVELGGESDDGVMVQFGVGVSYDVVHDLTVDLGYRYFESEDLNYELANGDLLTEYKGDVFTLGVRWYFFGSGE